jgi:hypothetical protein
MVMRNIRHTVTVDREPLTLQRTKCIHVHSTDMAGDGDHEISRRNCIRVLLCKENRKEN